MIIREIDIFVIFWYCKQMNTPREYIELFHLLFLDQLTRNIDNSFYALKGGCNLRFFFNSFRYSEDLDIDVKIIAVDTLKNKINRILTAAPFQHILKTHEITIDKISLLKQTKTTQRWKLALRTPLPLMLNTKIEFSRRGMNGSVIYESVDPNLIQHYHLIPILCAHYDKESAFIQKIEALAGRPQTQARDIFDIFLLFKTGILIPSKSLFKTNIIEQAQNNAFSIKFSDFKSQVISFLSSEYQEQYNSPKMWEKIVIDIVQHLELLK